MDSLLKKTAVILFSTVVVLALVLYSAVMLVDAKARHMKNTLPEENLPRVLQPSQADGAGDPSLYESETEIVPGKTATPFSKQLEEEIEETPSEDTMHPVTPQPKEEPPSSEPEPKDEPPPAEEYTPEKPEPPASPPPDDPSPPEEEKSRDIPKTSDIPVFTAEEINTLVKKLSLSDKFHLVGMAIKRLSSNDLAYLTGLLKGGLTKEDLTKAGTLISERFTEDDIKELLELYKKYSEQ